jgi:presenilin 1
MMELGLGDFWFYGILMTRAARLGWDVVILCMFAIVLGLAVTLFVLHWSEKPLPALPISLLFGMFMFVFAILTFRPFLEWSRSTGMVF